MKPYRRIRLASGASPIDRVISDTETIQPNDQNVPYAKSNSILSDSASKFIIILSVVHFVLCYSYLYFWLKGFDARIGFLFSAGDIFSLSIYKILPFYFSNIYFLYNFENWLQAEPKDDQNKKVLTVRKDLISWFRAG